MGGMTSFYGGPNGKSFYIKQRFSTRGGATDSLDNDLSKGWASPIQIGDYVIVSYGFPGDPGGTYNAFRDIDIKKYNLSFNFTIWRKAFSEVELEEYPNGLYYERVGSATGNTPLISLDFSLSDAEKDPTVGFDDENPDNPKLHLTLPKAQVFTAERVEPPLDANLPPEVELNKDDVNNPKFKFSLPVSLVIEEAQLEGTLNVGETPEVRLDTDEDGTVNNPVLKFKLPVAQQFLPSNVTATPEDADTPPSVTFENTPNVNTPTLTFHLPRAQVMLQPGLQVVGPTENPAVSLDENQSVNEPKLNFTLPQAANFYYGDHLGKHIEGTYTEEDEAFAGYHVGDYYINAATGFTYRVIAVDGNSVTFLYVACLQQPLPSVSTVPLSPYTGPGGTAADPVVNKRYTNEEQTEWLLEFLLPKAPVAQSQFDFIPSSEAGSVGISVMDADTLLFSFRIPKGARIFSGTTVTDEDPSALVPDAVAGDLYLNNETGDLYTLQPTGQWRKDDGNLKGPIGNPLNIVKQFTYGSKDGTADTLEAISAKLEEDYPGKPDPEDIIAVTYLQYDVENQEIEAEVSYWYFCLPADETGARKWGRAQLTGGTANLISTEYNDEHAGLVDNKTYSVHYINGLIDDNYNDGLTELNKRTLFSKDQVVKMMSWGEISDLIDG